MQAVLFLHGGGSSDHTRYRKIEEIFNEKGIITHSFDHNADSLIGRLDEAEQELSILKSNSHIHDSVVYVWGSSMGGHVASRLTENHPDLAGVILHSAAAYSQVSESLPFGPEFTNEITRPNSWEDSPAFDNINSYKGKVMVTYGEFDKVVPEGIKERFIARAKLNGKYHLIEGVGHSQLRPSTLTDFDALNRLIELGLKFVLTK